MKKLTLSICMLLVSALLLGTSTYAWFSMNKSVAATGLTVSAKSDTVFLVINTGSDFDANGTAVSATSTEGAKQLYPVAHGTAPTQSAVTVAGDMTDATKWFTAYSDSNASSTAAGDGTQLTAENGLTNYIASEIFSIGINTASGNDTAANLKVTSVTIPTDSGLVLVLVCGTNVFEFKASNASVTDSVLSATVSKTGVVVTAYYYVDGVNANVYTNNAAAVTGAIGFTVACD